MAGDYSQLKVSDIEDHDDTPHASNTDLRLNDTADSDTGFDEPLTHASNSPFINTTWPLNGSDKTRACVGGILLVPIRMVLFFTCALLTALYCRLATIGMDNKTPPSRFRRQFVMLPLKMLFRLDLLCLGFLHIKVKGKRDKEARVIVSNHVTWTDPLFFMCECLPSPVGAAELIADPVMKSFAMATSAILVTRGSAEDRARVGEAIKERGAEASWPQVLMFPESTTHTTSSILAFKYGAFKAKAPVQACVLRYKTNWFDPSWVVGGPTGFQILIGLMCQPYNFVEIEWLPIHRPTQEELLDVTLFARTVQKQMADALGVEASDSSVDDVRLATSAEKIGYPPNAVVVGTQGIKSQFKVTMNELKPHVKVFAAMDPPKRGFVTKDTFADDFQRRFHALSAEQRSRVEALFDNLTKGEEQLTFKEYLVRLALPKPRANPVLGPTTSVDLSSPTTTERSPKVWLTPHELRLSLAFEALDAQGVGVVGAGDLTEASRGTFSIADAERIARAAGTHRMDCAAFCRGVLQHHDLWLKFDAMVLGVSLEEEDSAVQRGYESSESLDPTLSDTTSGVGSEDAAILQQQMDHNDNML